MIYRFGIYELDTGVPELRADGSALAIEPQVFDLLTLLIENRSRTVTKEEIFEKVWDGRIVSDSALSSRIKALRHALGDSGKTQSVIQTFHSRGFRFVADVEIDDKGDAKAVHTPQTSPALPDRPSVVVLPFANLSGDPAQEYFSDGITEDVAANLARHRWLLVIGGSSTAGLKDRTPDARNIGQEYGSGYVVEGSVRRAADVVRISARLVRTDTGATIWTERYDRVLKDIFEVQDEISRYIAATIEPELSAVEAQKAKAKPPDGLNAWDLYQRGTFLLYSFELPKLAEAADMLQQAIGLDPEFAAAYARLAYVHIQKFWYDDLANRTLNLKTAEELALRAIALDERDALGHFALGRAYGFQGRRDEGIAKLRECIELNPGLAQPYFALGQSLLYSHRPIEGLSYMETARKLSPHDPHKWTFLHVEALTHYFLGDLEAALGPAVASVRPPTATHWPWATLTSIQGNLGMTGEAAVSRAGLWRIRPGYSCATAGEDFGFFDAPEFVPRYVDGLRKAGLPEQMDSSSTKDGH